MQASELDKLGHAIDGIRVSHKNREKWKDGDDADSLAGMIQHEAEELVEAVQEVFVTGEVFPVASEIGDLFVLLYRLCDELGLEPADCIQFKNKRNARKYDDHTLNNGYKPEEASAVAKAAWAYSGGDKTFSHVYLDVLAEL